MYESKSHINSHYFRNNVLPRPPPDHGVVAILSRSKDNRRHGWQNKINPPLNPQSNEAI